MALHDWIKKEWDGEQKGETWKTDFGELSEFELAKGLVNKPGDPEKARPNMQAIEDASVETMAREVNDPYWSQPDHATQVPEPPSDTEIFVKAAELATPKDVRDWKQRIFDEEQIRAEARAEVNPVEPYDHLTPTQEQREEFAAEAQAGEDEWEFEQGSDPYAYQPGDELPAEDDDES